MRRNVLITFTALAAFAVAGCTSQPTARRPVQSPTWADVDKAVAVIHPTKGNDVHGTVHFTDVTDGVRVVADVRGLEPGSKHGFHIHAYGDATEPDGTSAGGHYDPDATGHHARANAEQPHHAGDLGNLTANAEGRAHDERVIRDITVAGANNPIIGRGVIIHAKRDDFGQPTGNAGARIGLGVIGVADTE